MPRLPRFDRAAGDFAHGRRRGHREGDEGEVPEGRGESGWESGIGGWVGELVGWIGSGWVAGGWVGWLGWLGGEGWGWCFFGGFCWFFWMFFLGVFSCYGFSELFVVVVFFFFMFILYYFVLFCFEPNIPSKRVLLWCFGGISKSKILAIQLHTADFVSCFFHLSKTTTGMRKKMAREHRWHGQKSKPFKAFWKPKRVTVQCRTI